MTEAEKERAWVTLADAERAVKGVVNARGNAAKATGWDIVIALHRLDHKGTDNDRS